MKYSVCRCAATFGLICSWWVAQVEPNVIQTWITGADGVAVEVDITVPIEVAVSSARLAGFRTRH